MFRGPKFPDEIRISRPNPLVQISEPAVNINGFIAQRRGMQIVSFSPFNMAFNSYPLHQEILTFSHRILVLRLWLQIQSIAYKRYLNKSLLCNTFLWCCLIRSWRCALSFGVCGCGWLRKVYPSKQLKLREHNLCVLLLKLRSFLFCRACYVNSTQFRVSGYKTKCIISWNHSNESQLKCVLTLNFEGFFILLVGEERFVDL